MPPAMNTPHRIRPRSRLVALALVFAPLATPSPATAMTTRGTFDRPPFYHGKLEAPAGAAAHVAVSFRDEPGSLDPTPSNSPALAALLDSLRVELDRIGLTRPLAGGDWPMKDGPTIRLGCRRGGTGKDGRPLASDEVDPSEPRRMTFEVEGPGRAWIERVKQGAGDSIGVVVAIQLGFSEQWVRQTSWKGSKSIEIGTGRALPVAWLTSLDSPVQVLQLSGAALTPSGKVLRVGAEGLLARRTGMAASTLGAQEVLTEQDLAPLGGEDGDAVAAWREALRTLVAGLLREEKR